MADIVAKQGCRAVPLCGWCGGQRRSSRWDRRRWRKARLDGIIRVKGDWMMVAHVIRNEMLNNGKPAKMRPYKTNCVAMAFSKVLGIGVHATVNLFVSKGWVPDGLALEHDKAIQKVVDGLPLTLCANNESWSALKARLATLPKGRYFAVNNKNSNFNESDSAVGHAFAIVRGDGANWGIAGNNAEMKENAYNEKESYNRQIRDADKICIWGPA